MKLTRRRFLAVTAATAVCVGCSDSGDDDADAEEDVVQHGGFGTAIPIGTVEEVRDGIAAGQGAFYVPEARSWVVPADGDGEDAGFLGLYQKCTHLGCRVPWCASSKRFECPCHAAIFNRVGEYVDGPAARGMDRFAITERDDGQVVIDTTVVLEGPATDVQTVDGEPAGPVCIGVP